MSQGILNTVFLDPFIFLFVLEFLTLIGAFSKKHNVVIFILAACTCQDVVVRIVDRNSNYRH